MDGRMRHKRDAEVDFESKIISLQVVNGSQASLVCSVRALGQHEVSHGQAVTFYPSKCFMLSQVSWIHVDKQLLLTTQDVVRTTNPRIRIKRQNDTFMLMIDKVILQDVGFYACRVSDWNQTCHPNHLCSSSQINSRPPKSQLGFLDVLGAFPQS